MTFARGLGRLAAYLLVPTIALVVPFAANWAAITIPDRSAWNVLLITLDTTRADHLGAYGFAGAGTPNLDRLAREGVMFEQAESAAPLTLPAHASLFTGRFPFQHGLRDNGAVLEPGEQTLAQVLQAQGFRTAAFVASYILDARWGLARGFDTYDGEYNPRPNDDGRIDGVRRSADEVVNRALEWLETPSPSPFFAWLHFYDAHWPYRLPNGPADGVAGYDDAIAFMDFQVGRLLDFLDSHLLSDRTLVVVIGDHGESLDEHGERRHGLFVYEAVTRIPLMIRAPVGATRGRRVADVVRSVDVMPTVLELLRLPVPPRVSGASLTGRMVGALDGPRGESYSETMYPLYHFGWSGLRAVRAGRFKLIDAPRRELYDLERDPNELQNLYDSRPAQAAELTARLLAFEQRVQKSDSGRALDSEARRRLATLGYVASTATARPTNDLPDPKDKVDLYRLIGGDSARPTSGLRNNPIASLRRGPS
jgi:arylsulfatase A-like enzyme